MTKQPTPLVVGVIAIIVVAAGVIYWQMRGSSGPTEDLRSTSGGISRPPAGDEAAKSVAPSR